MRQLSCGILEPPAALSKCAWYRRVRVIQEICRTNANSIVLTKAGPSLLLITLWVLPSCHPSIRISQTSRLRHDCAQGGIVSFSVLSLLWKAFCPSRRQLALPGRCKDEGLYHHFTADEEAMRVRRALRHTDFVLGSNAFPGLLLPRQSIHASGSCHGNTRGWVDRDTDGAYSGLRKIRQPGLCRPYTVLHHVL